MAMILTIPSPSSSSVGSSISSTASFSLLFVLEIGIRILMCIGGIWGRSRVEVTTLYLKVLAVVHFLFVLRGGNW